MVRQAKCFHVGRAESLAGNRAVTWKHLGKMPKVEWYSVRPFAALSNDWI